MDDRYQYAAFISYSSSDAKFAERFHKALEAYRIPRSLGRIDLTGSGKHQNRVYPVFRDRDEMPSGDLSSLIEGNLRGSRALIVIGSAGAAKSEWVSKEIEQFLQMGRRGQIFGIVSADADPREEHVLDAFFPPILKDVGLTLVAGDARPKAGEARRKRDGFRNALIKVIAGITALNQDVFINRDRRRRRQQTIGMTVAGVGVVAAGLVGLRFAIAPMIQAEVMVARESTRRDVQRVEGRRRVEVELTALAARAWAAAETDSAQSGNVVGLQRGLGLLRDGLESTRYAPDQVPTLALEYVRYVGVTHEETQTGNRADMLSFMAQAEGTTNERAQSLWDSPFEAFFDSGVMPFRNGQPRSTSGPGGRKLECSLEESGPTRPNIVSILRNNTVVRTHRLWGTGCGVARWSRTGRYVAMSGINTAFVFSEDGELLARFPRCDRAFIRNNAPTESCDRGTHAVVIDEARRQLAIIGFTDGNSAGRAPDQADAATPPRRLSATMRVYDFGAVEDMSIEQLFAAEERQRALTPDWRAAFDAETANYRD